jgi:hypothetical protein
MEIAVLVKADAVITASEAGKDLIVNLLSTVNAANNSESRQVISKTEMAAKTLTLHTPVESVVNNPGFEERKGILFVASFTKPTTYDKWEGIWHFLMQIYPMIVKEIPSISVTIIGHQIPKLLRKFVQTIPTNENVIRLVESFHFEDKYYNQARLFIAPDLYTTGIHSMVSHYSLNIAMSYRLLILRFFCHKIYLCQLFIWRYGKR